MKLEAFTVDVKYSEIFVYANFFLEKVQNSIWQTLFSGPVGVAVLMAHLTIYHQILNYLLMSPYFFK